jgi:hypothetical protein
MRFKFFFGGQPVIKQYRAEDFSRNGYEGKVLLQTKHGIPVIIARNTALDIWKVQWGLSTVFFGTKAEAVAYCKGRFFDADGRMV